MTFSSDISEKFINLIRDEVKRALGGNDRKRIPQKMELGTIDPSYTAGSGRPKVVFDDDTSQNAVGPYPYLSTYTPNAGDRVLLARVGISGKLVVLGKLM